MTREEEHQSAIEWIEGLRDRWNDKDNVKYCNMAIKALEQTELEKCGDCISRQAAIREIDKEKPNLGSHREIADDMIENIKALHSVEPERKLGYWIHDEGWKCSVCHTHFSESKFAANDYGTPLYNYCPICGADLTGV